MTLLLDNGAIRGYDVFGGPRCDTLVGRYCWTIVRYVGMTLLVDHRAIRGYDVIAGPPCGT